MSDILKVAIGWNNAGGLAALSPQPSWMFGTFSKVDDAISGALWLQGRYLKADYQPSVNQDLFFTALGACGLSIKNAVYAAKITVQIPVEEDHSTANYNGWARYHGDGTRAFLNVKASIYFVNLIAI